MSVCKRVERIERNTREKERGRVLLSFCVN